MEVRLLVREDELSQACDQIHYLVIQRKEEYDSDIYEKVQFPRL
jgi:hypothetical protein